MFNKKPRFVDSYSVTRNPNKFGQDIILSLGNTKPDTVLGTILKEEVMVRLDKDAARRLCGTIMGYFDE